MTRLIFLRHRSILTMLLSLALMAASCGSSRLFTSARALPADVSERPLPQNAPPQLKQLVAYAVAQHGITTTYDATYQKLSYPGGDVPVDRGACTDVVIRAFRKADIDLQREVHVDMLEHFELYPQKWGLAKPDSNIDHRRVPNLQTFFTRQGKDLQVTQSAADYLPGDVVSWKLSMTGLDHVGVVTNLWSSSRGRYMMAHNIGAGVQIEDVLFAWQITGHYRYFE
jgi:uncharacterized protein